MIDANNNDNNTTSADGDHTNASSFIVQPPTKLNTDQAVEAMWVLIHQEIDRIDPKVENWKKQELPLGRIKKIMKMEEFALQEVERLARLEQQQNDGGRRNNNNNEASATAVSTNKATTTAPPTTSFMISAEAPALMVKACELLIRELATRAWQHTDSHRRKTLQRADIHAAVGESEVYDFLIDIVPRVSVPTTTTTTNTNDPTATMH